MIIQVEKPVKIYKNIIFDMGAVLVNWNPHALIKQLKKEDTSVSDDLLKISQTQAWKNFDKGIFDSHDVIAALQNDYPRRHIRMFIDAMLNQLQPLDEGLDLLYAVKAKGYKTFVLSNFARESFENCYKHYPFLHDLDGAVFSYAIGLAKPDPEIYFYLLENYKLNAEECLFIDDLSVNIQAGKCVGIDGIVCENHDKLIAELKEKMVL